MKIKDCKVGQRLYQFYIQDGCVMRDIVFVIKKNKSKLYFGYAKDSRINKNKSFKVLNQKFPIVYRDFSDISFIEAGRSREYISDDFNFGDKWEAHLDAVSKYHKTLERLLSEAFYRDNEEELGKLVYEFSKVKSGTKNTDWWK